MSTMMQALAPSETTLEAGGHAKGVAVAVVRQNKDSSGMGRVKVSYPWHSQPAESYWARVAAPMAGKDRGMYFLPEVDDEVLVAFERGDMRFPYIVGALWNGVDKSPESNGNGKNDVRQIRSRKGHKLTFDDGAKGRVQIELNDGKTVKIDDDGIRVDDGKGNSIVLDSKAGSVTVSATSKIELKAPQITIAATGKFEADGGGLMKLKAGLININ